MTSEPKRAFCVSIYETVPAYPAPLTYEMEVFGFGAFTIEEAEREGAQYVKQLDAQNGRKHTALIERFCTRCGLTGVEPGCRKKICVACNATGRVPFDRSEVAA